MGRNAIDKKWRYLYNEHIIVDKLEKIGKDVPGWHRTVREPLGTDRVWKMCVEENTMILTERGV